MKTGNCQLNGLRGGFTLIEVMVAMTIGTLLLASAYTTLLSLAKGSQSVVNYTEMNTQTRHALEIFGRDARMAEDVKTATALRAVLVVEGDTVEYRYEPTAKVLYRIVKGGTPRAVIFDVEDLTLNYYTLRHDPTNNPLEVKHIQLEAMLERRVISLANTNYIISARFMMRNKHVSN